MKIKSAQIFLTISLACFGLLRATQAVLPPPDGGYPGFNTAEGQNALLSLDTSTGLANTAVGWFSLKSNVDTSFNTAVGAGTLLANAADQNTAVGAAALLLNTTGDSNTALGVTALLNNTEGSFNTAIGVQALFHNTSNANTATGVQTLYSNSTGQGNVANGTQVLYFNTTGEFNTATGFTALEKNTTGNSNTATGSRALFNNTIGQENTAIGTEALFSNSTGGINTAVGERALLNNTGGAGNTAIGYLAGSNLTIGDDNICIGNDGVAGDGGTIRIGRSFIGATYIAGISGQTASGGAAVFVNSDGKLGTMTSSARFKDEIQTMGQASEAILMLRPVSFRYKKEIDPKGMPQFGLLAEEVEEVNPDLIIRDHEGKPHMVRYEQINAMLLNEFQKEHRMVEEQRATISELKAIVAQQEQRMKNFEAHLKKQAGQIQEVSVQMDMTKSGPRMAVNDQ